MIDDIQGISSEQLGIINKIVGPITKKFNDRNAQVAVEMRSGFYKYCERVAERCGLVKTILSKGERVELREFYVSPAIKMGKSHIDTSQMIGRLALRKRVIITGTAGLGKSVFLKNLAMIYSSSQKYPLPLFFELRDLNESKRSIEESLLELVNMPKPFLSKQQFDYALEEGLIAIFLDAFDELDFDIRNQYEKEIIKLTLRYPDAQIVITSRPSSEGTIEGWSPFEHARLQPFDLPRVKELIRKSKEEPTECEKFVDLVDQKLFQTHQSFLSTPLLALIMFLTYQVGGQIPDKLHEFYHRAFEALYYRHDNDKGHFARKKYVSLQRDQFLRMLSAICAITYFEGQTSLNEDDLLKIINEAKSIETIDLVGKDFLDDLIESVCLLQRDGTDIVFTHRSFQEYFTAMFILNSEVLDTFGIINRLISRQHFDNVVSMIGDMNREFIEKKWVLRWLDLYYQKTKDIDLETNIMPYFKFLRYSAVIFHTPEGRKFGLFGGAPDTSAIGAIIHGLYQAEYNEKFMKLGFERSKMGKENNEFLRHFTARDNIRLTRKKKDSQDVIELNLSDKDAGIFVGTLTAKIHKFNREFLFDLKSQIEERHKQKGEGFMTLIRNRGF